MPAAFAALGLQVLERGWLSANNVVFEARPGSPSAVVDTGYVSHADQTLALVDTLLPGGPARIINTHLHADHCGGNAALLAGGAEACWVPEPLLQAVNQWDTGGALSFDAIDQRCARFTAHHGLADGQRLRLGGADWQVHAAPGHDPDAVMLFEPTQRVLISGDALWERRVAIVFPELVGEDGIGAARQALDRIEQLAPRIVIPGHGAPFTDVADALAGSRERLALFAGQPLAHLRYALRALVMFNLLEHRRRPRADLLHWMTVTPLLAELARRLPEDTSPDDFAADNLDRLLHDRTLVADGADVRLP
ncbi:MBL fold metallo-hydrolase [Aquincola sp. J276]|uniref:MBL fold metallo-hydrolase n=1 Tax=Aquincola sp. J276 TaxID=2898432 RepID=UPI0021509E0C|nr:MBL fold metallo-hydrolase [Aquincola sp. J276]MCR5865782.1 MBL fold metallo-hydrolase [Aquincola sp. J276]